MQRKQTHHIVPAAATDFLHIHRYTDTQIQCNLGISRVTNQDLKPGIETRRSTVSFHNFKSQNFKLSVSNPKSKYVAYSSVLSQISNCQGLGHKNKHEILKTDRS